jgi:uncharacterized phage protein (TIGR01671 family)
MSRPIKFRAWYVTGERMITVNEDGGYATVPSLAELFRLADINRYELMQFTGLQDKNGTPIYEGDIVTGRNHKDEAGDPRKVEWSNSGYHANNLPLWALNKCEVIGNIYENPDLLKEE